MYDPIIFDAPIKFHAEYRELVIVVIAKSYKEAEEKVFKTNPLLKNVEFELYDSANSKLSEGIHDFCDY